MGKGCAGSLALFFLAVGMLASVVFGFNLGREYESRTKSPPVLVAPVVVEQPTRVPAPTSVPQSIGNTPASPDTQNQRVQEYAAKIIEPVGLLADALNALGELSQNPRLLNDTWRQNVALQIALVKLAHTNINDIFPPSEIDNVHRALVTGTLACD